MSIHGGEHITLTFFVYCKMDIAVTFKYRPIIQATNQENYLTYISV